MDMNAYMANVALGWVVASLALALEHVFLWEKPWRLTEPINYIVGVLTILAGCAVWAWRQAQVGAVDPWLALIAFSIICTSGGWVVFGYWVRGGLTFTRLRESRITDRKQAITGALNDTLDDLRRN